MNPGAQNINVFLIQENKTGGQGMVGQVKGRNTTQSRIREQLRFRPREKTNEQLRIIIANV